ncbi:hypothetical protein V2J56_09155 [Georgenia sp. MJ206]|uniref:hypothetical protein n=1 Tax=Georgenia wangjunii TaxID=3117730 RepID=UPI002F25F917
MPKQKTETIGGGDFAWLLTAPPINDNRTAVLDISAWTKSTHYPDGFIPSGTPAAKGASGLVPFDPTAGVTTGAGILAGFIFGDQSVVSETEDFAVPLRDGGRIRADKVPGTFTAPTVAAKLANTNFVFV